MFPRLIAQPQSDWQSTRESAFSIRLIFMEMAGLKNCFPKALPAYLETGTFLPQKVVLRDCLE